MGGFCGGNAHQPVELYLAVVGYGCRMEHGAGFSPDKVIQVTAAKTARAIVYHLKDPGDGFDPEDLKHAARSHDPDEIVASALTRAEMGLRPGGFGMLIARQVADELVYNERRNEVLMIKHLS